MATSQQKQDFQNYIKQNNIDASKLTQADAIQWKNTWAITQQPATPTTQPIEQQPQTTTDLATKIKSWTATSKEMADYNRATWNQQWAREIMLSSPEALKNVKTTVTAEEAAKMAQQWISNVNENITADLQWQTIDQYNQQARKAYEQIQATPTPKPTEVKQPTPITAETQWKDTNKTPTDLEQMVEARYWTIATQNPDGTITADINGKKYQWTIDKSWNPVKTEVTTPEQIQAQQQIDQTANQNFVNQFNTLLSQWASSTDLSLFIKNNSALYDKNKAQISALYKQNLINTWNQEFVNKYNWYTAEQLFTAVQNWEVIPWSDKYNLLSPELRASYETYSKWQIATWNKWLITWNATSFNDLVSQVNSMFSTDIRKQYNDMLNSPDIKNLETKNNDLTTQINDIDDQLEYIREDAIKSNPELAQNSFSLNAVIRDQQRDLNRQRNTLLNQYNSNLATISNMKTDFQAQIDISKYEDQNKKDAYTTALNMYQYQQNRMDEWDKIKFEQESSERATQKQQDFQKELIAIQQKYEQENKQWVYQQDRNWNLLYIIDWKATQVKDAEWKIVWTARVKDYTDSFSQLDDWTIQIIRQYDDATKWINWIDVFTMWVNWTDAYNWSMSVYSAIWDMKQRTGKYSWKTWYYQCWEWVNYYVKDNWLTRSDWQAISMWSTYESKKMNINSQSPQVWWLVVWNPTWDENWHTWIVTWYNPQSQTVRVKDWNWWLDMKESEHEVSISSIVNWDGWFVWVWSPNATTWTTTWTSWVTWWYSDAQLWLMWSITTLNTTSTKALQDAWLTTNDYWLFKAWWLQPTASQMSSAQSMVNSIDELLNHSNLNDAVWAWDIMTPTLSWKTNDFINKFDSFLANLTKDNLWTLKWPMSDKDVAFIKSMSSSINRNTDEQTFKDNLKKLKDRYSWIAWWNSLNTYNWTTTSWFTQYTNKTSSWAWVVNTSWFNSLLWK